MAGRYFQKKVSYFGITFDSQEEANVYLYLRERLRKGEISQLHRQVAFEIIPRLTKTEVKHLKTKDKLVERLVARQKVYTCDFLYREGNKIVIIEVKNYFTKQARDYPLRRDLMAQKILEHNKRRGKETFSFQEVTQMRNKQIKTIIIV